MINISSEQNINRNRRIEKIISCVEGVLQQNGYMGLSLPMFEYYELLRDTVYNFSDESIIRFVDRSTGRTLVLRPDFTPQVCRYVSGIDDLYLPFRVSYKGSVFRSVEKDRGIKSEEYQIGWELFGEPDLYGDIEIVLVSNDCLQSAGITGYIFTFGDSLFLNRIKELGRECGADLMEAVSRRQIHEIKKILEVSGNNLPVEYKNLVLKLPLLFGGMEILSELKELSKFDEVLYDRLLYIEKLFSRLVESGVDKTSLIFDGAESKGLDYYTGINFEILHHDCGGILGGGGRYDKLMSKFNKDIEACGVALNLDVLISFSECVDCVEDFDYLVTGEENFNKYIELRKKGYKVLFLRDKNNREEFTKMYRFKEII